MKKIILSLALLLIVYLTFNIEHCFSQWYPLPQFPTYLETTDVKFFDENTGVLTIVNQTTPPPGIFRTTNGGQNWNQIKFCSTYGVQKIDSSTVYIAAYKNGYCFIYRTYDKGQNWDSVAYSGNVYRGISFVNRDTGWVTGFNGLYCIWRTNDGGRNLFVQSTDAGKGEVFFLKQKVNGEYIGWVNNSSALWKTTDSGINWFQVTCPGTDLRQITFVDENTGWVSKVNMYKTTDGGLNWVDQPLAPGITNVNRIMRNFSIINKDTIYGAGGYKYLPNSHIIAMIWKTTNGGTVWGFQEVDSSYHVGYVNCIDFINANTGWAFEGNGLKTTNAGGSFTSIHKDETIVNYYKLFQNYPNPFNAVTIIKFTLKNSEFKIQNSVVELRVYDIIGKEVAILINGKKQIGTYTVKFDADELPTGIYFYRLILDGIPVETKKMILLK